MKTMFWVSLITHITEIVSVYWRTFHGPVLESDFRNYGLRKWVGDRATELSTEL